MGIMFFWTLGALAHLNIDQFVVRGRRRQADASRPAAGGAGHRHRRRQRAGRHLVGGPRRARHPAAGRPGPGLVPLLLFTVEGEFFEPAASGPLSYIAACVLLFLLGCSAGLFDVPLASYMQHYSPTDRRGSVLAASNLLTFGGMLLAALAFGVMRMPVHDGSLENVTRAIRRRSAIASHSPSRCGATVQAEEAARPRRSTSRRSSRSIPNKRSPGRPRRLHTNSSAIRSSRARQIFFICGMLTDAGAHLHRRADSAGDDPLHGVAAHAHVLQSARLRHASTCPRKAPRCSRRTTSRGSTACCWSPSRRGRCG